MKKYAAIFDMDGVIADTNPYHTLAFKQFFDKLQISFNEDDFKKHMYGRHNSYIMRYFIDPDLSDTEIAQLEKEKELIFREIYEQHAVPVNGLPDFLEDLRRHDFILGVATSAPRENMELILEKLNLKSFFSSTLSGNDVSKHKPDPQVYLQSAAQLGVDPRSCMVFEDSYSGATAGINAGMAVTAVLTSHPKDELPDCVDYIRDFTETSAAKVIALLSSWQKS